MNLHYVLNLKEEKELSQDSNFSSFQIGLMQ